MLEYISNLEMRLKLEYLESELGLELSLIRVEIMNMVSVRE